MLKRTFKGDKIIWIIVVLLSLISLIAVYSSSSSLAYREGQSELYYLLRQGAFILVGLGFILICQFIPLRLYRMFCKLAFWVFVGLLFYTMFFGTTLNDGTRWVRLLGFSFQPSEFAKIFLILYIAKVLEEHDFQDFKSFALHLLLPVALCVLPIFWGSISSSILVSASSLLLLMVAGVKWRFLGYTCGIAGGVALLAVVLSFTTPAFPRIKTAITRITTLVEEEKDPAKDFQAKHAKIAVASGGVIGKFPGNSTQRYILPHPYSDFIFATIIEETGLVGCFVLIFLYSCLFYRIITLSQRCTRPFSTLTVMGLGLIISLQALIHMCVNVGLGPVTGQTLPLVSLGGTSVLATCISFGIILCISRTLEEAEEAEETEETDSPLSLPS